MGTMQSEIEDLKEIVGGVVFLGCWVYCFATYGFLLGITLGLLASLILMMIAREFWYLALLAIVIFLYFFGIPLFTAFLRLIGLH